jgi:hypothetical protein
MVGMGVGEGIGVDSVGNSRQDKKLIASSARITGITHIFRFICTALHPESYPLSRIRAASSLLAQSGTGEFDQNNNFLDELDCEFTYIIEDVQTFQAAPTPGRRRISHFERALRKPCIG